MSMKTILVPTENHVAMQSTLRTALLLARWCDSYIEGFALRRGINDFVTVDMGVALPAETYRQDIARDAGQAQQIFETFMQEQHVPRSTGATGSLSFDWLDDASEGDSFVGSYGRVFDVIVMSRPDANSVLRNSAIESALFESGRPILISPPSPLPQIGTNILIAWNCSTEQARASALALPLLQRADRVTVLTVVGGTGVLGPPPQQLIRYLQFNGIAAEPLAVDLNGGGTGEAILATADSLGCDLLIKGAYTQSRLRQMIFGGATRHVLEHANLPVLLAH
jgi:nucleotide-binding universal stress UspA family protein